MGQEFQEIAWKEMRATYQNYDRGIKMNLLFVIVFFAILLSAYSFIPGNRDVLGISILAVSQIIGMVFYIICFDTLMRVASENQNKGDESQSKDIHAEIMPGKIIGRKS